MSAEHEWDCIRDEDGKVRWRRCWKTGLTQEKFQHNGEWHWIQISGLLLGYLHKRENENEG